MGEEDSKHQTKVVEATHVYLLMNDAVRISRNSRASWYLKQLNGIIDTSRVQALEGEELQVLSVLPTCASATPFFDGDGDDSQSQDEVKVQYKITPDTNVTFLAKRYRIVFLLDISPSAGYIDIKSPDVLFNRLFSSLSSTIHALILPFKTPASETTLCPQLYITVIAHSSLVSCDNNQVLIQGCIVSERNVESILSSIQTKLMEFQSRLIEKVEDVMNMDSFFEDDSSQRITGNIFTDIVEPIDNPDPTNHHITPENSFLLMLRHGILALQLLPENSAAHIVMITDGVVGVSETSMFDTLMAHLRHQTISCSFMQISSKFSLQNGFGFVPYPELLQFIATSTFGAYFAQRPTQPKADGEMNIYHKSLYTWSFQKAVSCVKIDNFHEQTYETLNENLAFPHSIQAITTGSGKQFWATPLLKKKERDILLQTPLSSLLSCRLREGYTIKDVKFNKGGTEIEVCMMLPWRDNVWIHCLLQSAWPLNNKRQTHMEVVIEASYDFLHNVSATRVQHKNNFGTSLVKKYWQTIQGMSETDQLLVHLQSFTTNPFHYQVPESVKKGVPVFFSPPNSPTPQVSLQLNIDSQMKQFVTFWENILLLDIKIWQKWMHTQRIGVILAHDHPTGKHLHIQNSNGRFHHITCRQSITSLNMMLSEWSTFVLMDAHSYIKLMYTSDEADGPPTSFCVIRQMSKPPCLILLLAFLGGTSGQYRYELLTQLRERISGLTFPERGSQTQSKKRLTPGHDRLSNKHCPPLQRVGSQIPCCVITHKAIEKILVRYDSIPQNLYSFGSSLLFDRPGELMQNVIRVNKLVSSVFMILSRYLHHCRWIWSVQNAQKSQFSTAAIGRILSNIAKVRLQEGFNYAHANSGIINLLLEVDMQVLPSLTPEKQKTSLGSSSTSTSSTDCVVNPCVVQYIIFPPYCVSNRELGAGDAEDDDLSDGGEYQIITECWIEPQLGHVVNSSTERAHLDGMDYTQLAKGFFDRDYECVSTMVTFEHLMMMCQHCTVDAPSSIHSPGLSVCPSQHSASSISLAGSRSGAHSKTIDETIQHIPLPFDLMALIPKCQQTEILFHTYKYDPSKLSACRPGPHKELHDNDLLFHMFLEDMETIGSRELELTQEQCGHLVKHIAERERPCKDAAQMPFAAGLQEMYFPPEQGRGTEHDVLSDPSHCIPGSGLSGSTVQIDERCESVTSSAPTVVSMGSSSIASVNKPTGGAVDSSTLPGDNVRSRHSSGHRSLAASLSGTSGYTDRDTHTSLFSENIYDGEQNPYTIPCAEDLEEIPLQPTRVVPEWRCFLRALEGTDLLITFVPASFDDLRLLINGPECLKEPTLTTDQGTDMNVDNVTEANNIETSPSQATPTKDPTNDSSDAKSCDHSIDQSADSTLTCDSEMSDVESINNVAGENQIDMDLDIEGDENSPSVVGNIGAKPAQSSNKTHSTPISAKPPPTDTPSSTKPPPIETPPGTRESLTLPVYVFYCTADSLTDKIVNRWTHVPTPDMFLDMTLDDVSIDTENATRHRCDSEGISQKLPDTSCSDDNQDELRPHLHRVIEHYFRCFAKGVYENLQYGCDIDCNDVEKAINLVCEETSPVELDITPFLHSICGHLHNQVKMGLATEGPDILHLDDIRDTPQPQPEFVINGKDIETGENEPPCELSMEEQMKQDGLEMMGDPDGRSELDEIDLEDGEKSRCTGFPIPHIEVSISSLLHEYGAGSCEASKDLHSLTWTKFSHIIKQYFTPVPSCPEFYFYSAKSESFHNKFQGVDGDDIHGNHVNTDLDSTRPNHPYESEDITTDCCDDLNRDHDVCSTDSRSSISDYIEFEDDQNCPLFLHLTCTVRYSGSIEMKSIPVYNLPLCIEELSACFTDRDAVFNLDCLRITLDMICLVLPTELEVPSQNNKPRPSLQRLASHVSQLSYLSEDFSQDGDNSEDDRCDPLDSLMTQQRTDIKNCKEQINWLLQDEIASAYRLSGIVNEEVLSMVETHVMNSDDKAKCISDKVPLTYVYGPAKSNEHFIKAFKEMDLDIYQLNEVSTDYYYLTLVPTLLDREVEPQLQGIVEERPGSDNSKMNDDRLAQVRSRLEKLPTEHLHDLHDDNDTSVEVISDERINERTTEQAMEAVEMPDYSHQGNIKISLIRPSPVKENPGFDLSKLGAAEREVVLNGEDDDGSSSDSSIKVIEEDVDIEQQDIEQQEMGAVEQKLQLNMDYMKPPGEPVHDLHDITHATADRIPENAAEATPREDTERPEEASAETTSQKPPETTVDRPLELHADQKLPKAASEGTSDYVPAEIVAGKSLESSASSELFSSSGGHVGVDSIHRNSPLTVSGSSVDINLLKRTPSSNSVEKLKRRFSGPLTPNRSRHQSAHQSAHQSGLQTPMSGNYDGGSVTGYDGDDDDGADDYGDEEDVCSLTGFLQQRPPVLPNFWLIMRVYMDHVMVYFHTRDLLQTGISDEVEKQKTLYNTVVRRITEICKTVNQHLLLKELAATKICNSLLVEPADEDVKWSKSTGSANKNEVLTDDSDSEAGTNLAATMEFRPGRFQCGCVHQEIFVLHPRLKTAMVSGVQNLKNALNQFAVSNRKNLFVIEESNSDRIFYLRLHEKSQDLTAANAASENGLASQDSTLRSLSTSQSSLFSVSSKRHSDVIDESTANALSLRIDDDSLSSSMSSCITTSKKSDVVLLKIYGICKIDDTYREKLVNMLKNRLAESVLDQMTMTLARNPMSKLTCDDVEFIQPPNCSHKDVSMFTIPPSAMLHQFVLGHYLRQNLLQFLTVPKYADTRQIGVFRDCTVPGAPAIPNKDVFLYNRPPKDGRKGIACLQLIFVDGKGTPIELICCPKPSPLAYKDILETSMFEGQVETKKYKIDTTTKHPGPPAVVQFNIWRRGEVDLPQLEDKLQLALKHAVCDIITEYRLLTAPLCEAPHHYSRGVPSPMHSAPSSPIRFNLMHTDHHNTTQQESSSRKMLQVGDRTPREKSSSYHIQAMLTDSHKMSPALTGMNTPLLDGSASTRMHHISGGLETDGLHEVDMELKEKFMMYECGKRGHLLSTYNNTIRHWFDFCFKLGVVSVHKYNYTLLSRSGVDYVLRNLTNKIAQLIPDTDSPTFRKIKIDDLDDCFVWKPHVIKRNLSGSTSGESKLNRSLDLGESTPTPGRSQEYIMIARNIKQWKCSIGFEDDSPEIKMPPLDNPKTNKSYQRFQPLQPTPVGNTTPDRADPAQGSTQGSAPTTPNTTAFVPRQRLLLFVLTDKKIELYTYNLANELVSSLHTELLNLIHWQNARSHLTTCIVTQKLGLFHHSKFENCPPDQDFNLPNMHAQNDSNIDSLIKHTAPSPSVSMTSRTSSVSSGTRSTGSTRDLRPGSARRRSIKFDDVYRDNKPQTVMHKSKLNHDMKDLLHLHGCQMMEVRNREKNEAEKSYRLEQLYMMWQQRGSSHIPSIPVTLEVLDMLKNCSRLLHSVSTPLLFSPRWRRQVLGEVRYAHRHDSSQSTDSKPRSRHSSGTSMRSKRSDSIDSKKRQQPGESTDQSKTSSSEELWHIEIREAFLSQYQQYLQSVGFCVITLQLQLHPNSSSTPTSSAKVNTRHKSPRSGSRATPTSHSRGYQYLQKTMPGGILLLEIGFKHVYFFVNVYAYECSRLPIGKSVSQMLATIFTQECDGFKDLTHMHSFAHDFHLRSVQSYLSRRHSVASLNQGYHLVSLLHDFVRQFQYAPTFARNFVYESTLVYFDTNSSGHDLFEYMVTHEKHSGMKTLHMQVDGDEELEVVTENALYTQFPCKELSTDDQTASQTTKPEDFEVGLVVIHDRVGGHLGSAPDQTTTLKLRFYVILTSKKDLFPEKNQEHKKRVLVVKQYSATGSFACYDIQRNEEDLYVSSSVGRIGGLLSSLAQAEEEKKHTEGPPGGRVPMTNNDMRSENLHHENVNYMGYSDRVQRGVYVLLKTQVNWCRDELDKMVNTAMCECRRDILWTQMLASPNTVEEGRRKRSDIDDKEARMTFTEFCELLPMVTKHSLYEVDAELVPLHNMPISWYNGLAKVLINKNLHNHRIFTNQDELVKYVVIFNPNELDMVMMLMVDHQLNKTDLCAIYRKDPGHPISIGLFEGFVNACCFHMWAVLNNTLL